MSVHPTGLSGIHEPRKDDILIAFMGLTGVGKSYFIDLLTGQSGKRAGHTLKSVTADIQATRVRHPVHGDRVVLVDTPGFDNTTRTDMEIFVMINDWLAKVYKSDVKLIEFIYLHRITDNRMFGPYNDLRIFGIFGWLCNVVATHVTLVSTMWEKIDPAVGAKTEGQLRELLLWKNLIDKGSGVDRLQRSDPRDAWRIVNQLINRGTEREVLLQEEIVDLERGRLNGAKTFCTQQQKVLSDKKEALKSLLAQVEKSDDPKLKKKLEEGLDQFEKDWLLMKELQRQIKRSGSGGEQRFLKRFSLLADLDWQHKDASMANRIARGLLLQIVRSTSIVKTVAGASVILAHKNNAQLLVNYMDMVLREGHVAMPDDQNRILTLLSKIVVSHGVIPEYHKLSSIKLQDTSAGSGTYGVVFRGLQDDSVCVKVMRNEHKLEEYLKELILWAHISHDNILPLHGVFLKQKMEISLVSPWMENGNLKDYVKATKDRQESRMPLLSDVVCGLSHLHGLGIIHSDLKGENVLISHEKRALIADFGASHISTATASSGTGSAIAGTPSFAAPEFFDFRERGRRPTKACDIWSFGGICYQVFSGMTPYEGLEYWQVVGSVVHGCFPARPTKEPDTIDDTKWEFLTTQCWASEPENRPDCEQISRIIKGWGIPDNRPEAKGVQRPQSIPPPKNPKIKLDRIEKLLLGIQAEITR